MDHLKHEVVAYVDSDGNNVYHWVYDKDENGDYSKVSDDGANLVAGDGNDEIVNESDNCNFRRCLHSKNMEKVIRKNYPTDLTDKQWAKIELLFVGMRKRKFEKRELVNAVLYLVKTGCQ